MQPVYTYDMQMFATYLRLGRVANEALRLVEGDVRRRRAVALVVRDDLHRIVLPACERAQTSLAARSADARPSRARA